MAFTAMTAPLPVKAEVRVPCKQLLASNGVVVTLLVLTLMTMIVVTVRSTARLLPAGLSPYPLALGSTYYCGNILEHCSPISKHAITWPPGPQLYGCSCR
jgi:hypothetical protein